MPDTIDIEAIGARIREARTKAGIGSLEVFADMIRDRGHERPSGAKLSRIETGVQPVPLDILDAVSEITLIPARDLRPDLASLFKRAKAGAGRLNSK